MGEDWLGYAVACAVAAFSVPGMTRRVRIGLSVAAAAFAALYVVKLRPWQADVVFSLEAFWSSLAPIVIVAVVALMLWSQRRAAGGISKADVEAIVAKRIAEMPLPEPRAEDGERDRAVRDLTAALQTLVEPMKAKAELAKLESVRVPKLPPQERFTASEGENDRSLELASESLVKVSRWIDDADLEISRITGRRRLDVPMKQAEDNVRGDARFNSQLPEDAVTWASGDLKQRWHIVQARLGVLEHHVRVVKADLERRTEPQIGRTVGLIESATKRLGPL